MAGFIAYNALAFISLHMAYKPISQQAVALDSEEHYYWRSTDDYTLTFQLANSAFHTKKITSYNSDFLNINQGDSLLIGYSKNRLGTHVHIIDDSTTNTTILLKNRPSGFQLLK